MANSDPFRPTTSTPGTGATDPGTGAGVKERVSDMADQARDKASELGKNAADAIDSGRHTAAHKLQDTAASLRNTGASGGSTVSSVANRAADGLDAAGRYIQDHDPREVFTSLEQIVRRNPGPSLVAAAAVGFIIGTALRGSDRS